jgi:hypothetical protein
MPDGNLRIYGLTFGPFEPFTTTPGQFEAFCKWLESEAGWKLRQMLSAGKSQQVSMIVRTDDAKRAAGPSLHSSLK